MSRVPAPQAPAGRPRRRHYDVAIVGGGHNGLVAAAYVARAGRSCVLLERLDRFGGAAVSEALFAGRDARLSSYAYLVSLLPARIAAELDLAIELAPRRVSSYSPDPRVGGARGLLVDRSDPAASAASFAAVSGSGSRGALGGRSLGPSGGRSDLEAWDRLYAMTRRLARAIFPTLLEPLRSREQIRELVGDAEAWETVFERPLGETVASWFEDDLVGGVVLTDALIGTFADVDARDLRQNRCFLYHVIGAETGEWQVPVGGMGSVSGELERAARRFGAELRSDCEVLSLQPGSDGCEVRCADGSFSADRVLAGVAPVELARLLGETPPSPAPEGAQLKVNLLLSRLPRLRDPLVTPEQAFAGTFHVNETAVQLRAAHREASAGRMPDPVPCEAYCHSLTDRSILGPELRDAGAQTMTVFALQMPARLFAGDPEGARERALAATLRSLDSVLAEPIAGCMMHTNEGHPCVEVRSPLDLERELRMPGGHIFHADLSWPFAEREEEVGSWGVETAHPSILLCGAGARRGGGVSGIPGRNAATAALGAGRASR